jgi:eukaryotic-like serine/threonine-protein kinase
LFALAKEKSAAERAVFLQAHCGGDSALRQRLEALLAAHDQQGGWFDNIASESSLKHTEAISGADLKADEAVGQAIGRYKLLEKVGEGGCGVVYVAEQTEPVRRRVALKVIKLGMDTRAVVARFEAERQALAIMDHPNISKVLDAGTTEVGRPYFVMEFVRGIRITDYCDQAQLSTKERLDLFIKVCHAIQHAHQKGIIHRDIKPSNILVTLHDGVPVPKVIDFGIAKATEGRLTEHTLYTNLHQFIGTPAYMSPEQAEMSGLDSDTRGDIYSLGVLLYELLTGSTPFDARELVASGIEGMRRTIREKEPPRPSTKLTQVLVAASRQRAGDLPNQEGGAPTLRRYGSLKEQIKLLRGDLDWIVMKCLEKDRTRRYETANGLAADLKRHLHHEPVVARPPSAAYRFQKAFRRNKLIFAAASAVLIALITGLGAAAMGLRQAIKERNIALAAQTGEEVQRREAQKAQANEAEQRRAAEIQELAARRRAYVADMNLAQQALALNNVGRALSLLNQHRPSPGKENLRGWEWRYLWQFCQSESLFTLGPMQEPIKSLSASQDGRWVAAVGMFSQSCRIWDLRTKAEVHGIAPNSLVHRLAFCPQRSLLAVACSAKNDGSAGFEIQLWNVAKKQWVQRLALKAAPLQLALSLDGGTIAAASFVEEKRRIFCWRVADGALLSEFDAPDIRMFDYEDGLVLSADGKLAAYALLRNRFRVVETATGRELWVATATEGSVTALAFSPDGERLATGAGSGESEIKLWDVKSGNQIGQLQGHRAWVPCVAFGADGKTLVSASADQTIRIWDLESQRTQRVLRGHQDEVWRVALLPDQTAVISAAKDGVMAVWDPAGQGQTPEFFTVPKKLILARFSPDGQDIIALDESGSVARWHGSDFREEEKLFEVDPSGSAAYFSGEVPYLAITTSNSVVEVWDVLARKVAHTFSLSPSERVRNLDREGRGVYSSKQLATWSHEAAGEVVALRSLPAGEIVCSWTNPPGKHLVAVSEDAQLALSLGPGQIGTLRELSTGAERTGTVTFESRPWAALFSPDGQFFAMATEPGMARFWNTATFEEIATVKGHLLSIHAIGFSKDMKRFVTGSLGIDAVKVWDFRNKLDLITLPAEGALLGQTEFSPDGNTLAALNWHGALRLWRAPSWAEIEAAESKKDTKQP